MNKKRLAILAAIYRSAQALDNMDNKFLIENTDGSIDNLFDIQYLAMAGYIDISVDDLHYAVITFDGVNFIEDYIESIKENGYEYIDFSGRVNLLLLDKIDRGLDNRA